VLLSSLARNRADLLSVGFVLRLKDQEWLDDLNRERKREQSDQISYELFEIVMDRFEKEWFDLVSSSLSFSSRVSPSSRRLFARRRSVELCLSARRWN